MTSTSKPFGYVYDERMLQHDCGYDSTVAECPRRIKAIYERLMKDQLLDSALKIEAREATDEELLLNHPEQLINEIRNLETATVEECEEYGKDKELVWTCDKTNMAARVAVGGSIEVMKAMLEGRVHNGFSIVRPPGHHSYGLTPKGYCIFNNTAICAKYALEKCGIQRVAIIDYDYHAGNGIYESVKNDDRIHFTSIHAHHHGAFWPFSTKYDYDTNNPNLAFVPLNGSQNTEGDYVSVFLHVIIPMLKQFKPELILIASGFDAGYYDIMMEYGQSVKAHGYGHMVRLLEELCPGKTLAVLEGGYFEDNYTECAAMTVRGLTSQPLPALYYPRRLSGSLTETVLNLLEHHSQWYPAFEKKLAKLKQQQVELGHALFLPHQKIFLGEKMRVLYDEMQRLKIVKTREWLPKITEEMYEMCVRKIEEYKQEYQFTIEHSIPSEEFLNQQLIWDDAARRKAFLETCSYTTHLVNEFNDFVEGRLDSMIICDKVMYREAVKNGRMSKLSTIRN